MRSAFVHALLEEAEYNDNIYLLTADMGFGLIEPFAEKYPDRFINVGVAEQNMIGVASGLALSGKTVFCYSIANFPTLRCLEQIRNDVCYHNLNVCIVAGNTGVSYGELGSSHHATEDIAIMRALPNMTVVAPGDVVETDLAVHSIAKGIGASYLRLGKVLGQINYEKTPSFTLGKAQILRMNSHWDSVILATGSMLPLAVAASDKLVQLGYRSLVLSIPTIKPLDETAIMRSLDGCRVIVTMEEHSIVGGLGSAVAEVMSQNQSWASLVRMGLKDEFCMEVGSQQELLKRNHLTVEDVVMEVCKSVKGNC